MNRIQDFLKQTVHANRIIKWSVQLILNNLLLKLSVILDSTKATWYTYFRLICTYNKSERVKIGTKSGVKSTRIEFS